MPKLPRLYVRGSSRYVGVRGINGNLEYVRVIGAAYSLALLIHGTLFMVVVFVLDFLSSVVANVHQVLVPQNKLINNTTTTDKYQQPYQKIAETRAKKHRQN